ncbi:hypothetical protein CF65_02253 [Aggregatibacter actinomycetemcomitans HK1651]|nr:hypothetical protein CF65_02253 [Aggregatibacter actinomycetemcomitans HK1651]
MFCHIWTSLQIVYRSILRQNGWIVAVLIALKKHR